MKTGRAIGIGVASLLVILAVAAWFLLRSLDSLVERAIEHYGSAATGTQVSVEDVEIDLRGARGAVRGLRVANPPGYSGQAAFALRGIEIGLDAGSLTGEPVVVTHVRVEEPLVHLEVDTQGRTNVGRIREHVEAQSKPAAEPPAAPSGGEPTKLAIRELVFAKGTVRASAPGTQEATAVLPSFTLRDLGGRQGATGAGIAQEILLELSRRAVVAAGGTRVKDALQERVEKELGGEAGEAARGLLDRVVR